MCQRRPSGPRRRGGAAPGTFAARPRTRSRPGSYLQLTTPGRGGVLFPLTGRPGTDTKRTSCRYRVLRPAGSGGRMPVSRRVGRYVVLPLVVITVAVFGWYRLSDTGRDWRYRDKLAGYCQGLIPEAESAVFTDHE